MKKGGTQKLKRATLVLEMAAMTFCRFKS